MTKWVNHDHALHEAFVFIEKHPGAVEGQNGDQNTFVTCGVLIRDFDLHPVEALGVLLAPLEGKPSWNDRCSPPWSIAALFDKVNTADKYGGPRETRCN